MMTYSEAGVKLTESFEGCRLTAYQDSGGIWTCGYGHTQGVTSATTCTQEQAEQWLDEDIQWAERIVNQYVVVPLNQGQYDSLVDFVFNVGSGNFLTSSLLEILNQGNYQEAALEFPKWDRAAGQVLPGLLRRRQAEQAMFSGLPVVTDQELGQ